MNEWICRFCRALNSPAVPVCLKCETIRGAQCPGAAANAPPVGGFVLYRPRPAEIRRQAKHADHDTITAELAETLLADIKHETELRKVRKPRIRYGTEDTRHMLEVAPVDLHVGKRGWGEETGEADYDLALIEPVFCSAISDIVEQATAYTLDKIVFVIGNDLNHVDNLSGTTTSGTPVDPDTRFQKAFRRARALMSWAIDELAHVAPVHVPVIPGNHDRLGAWFVGEILEAEFAHHPAVFIDNSPRLRKYVRYGNTLIGYTHGSEEKFVDLPLILAQEAAKDWGEVAFREVHMGHFHKAKQTRFVAGDTLTGVEVSILPSLSGVDSWHASHGFIHPLRACEGRVYNFTTGLRAVLRSSVVPERTA